MRILIVEDESSIATGLKFNFQQEGYDSQIAGDGPTALELLRDRAFDLVVLDLMLPGMSGYEICKEIREFQPQMPILVLSARALSQDKAHAFDCGADQYLPKPFDLNELLSRVRNLLNRRSRLQAPASNVSRSSPEIVEFGDVRVELSKFLVTVRGQQHHLTTMELQLLRYFLENEGIVLARAQILSDVWGQSPEVNSRSIDNFVMRLRKIVEPDPTAPRHIVSVRGIGYRFVAQAQPPSESSGEKLR